MHTIRDFPVALPLCVPCSPVTEVLNSRQWHWLRRQQQQQDGSGWCCHRVTVITGSALVVAKVSVAAND